MEGFKAVVAPNTTSVIEKIGWVDWPVRSYERVLSDEKVKKPQEGEEGEKMVEMVSPINRTILSQRAALRDFIHQRLMRLKTSVIHWISLKRGELRDLIHGQLTRLKASIINRIDSIISAHREASLSDPAAVPSPTIDVEQYSRFLNIESKMGEFLILDDMPEIKWAREKALRQCVKEKGPRTSLWSESNFTRVNFWEFEVEELLHCVKFFEVNM